MAKPAQPVPPGFHTLTVHLTVRGCADYIDFLKRAFSAVEISRSPGPDGKIMHANMRVGDSVLMVNDDFPEMGAAPIAEGNWPLRLNLYVPDADASWAQAIAAGCQQVCRCRISFGATATDSCAIQPVSCGPSPRIRRISRRKKWSSARRRHSAATHKRLL